VKSIPDGKRFFQAAKRQVPSFSAKFHPSVQSRSTFQLIYHLAVAAKQPFPQAASVAGFKEARSVSELVERFNEHGLAGLAIAAGRGRKPTYTSEQQARIIAEVQRPPEREVDQTATWPLMTLRRALRQKDLPEIAAETIRQVLHEAGYRDLRTRTWVRTGYALRVRKSGTVTTFDPETPEKKD
jgi:transposase